MREAQPAYSLYLAHWYTFCHKPAMLIYQGSAWHSECEVPHLAATAHSTVMVSGFVHFHGCCACLA